MSPIDLNWVKAHLMLHLQGDTDTTTSFSMPTSFAIPTRSVVVAVAVNTTMFTSYGTKLWTSPILDKIFLKVLPLCINLPIKLLALHVLTYLSFCYSGYGPHQSRVSASDLYIYLKQAFSSTSYSPEATGIKHTIPP